MNENREISAESQHNFYFLVHFNSKTTEQIFTIISQDVEQLVELLTGCMRKAMVHFVSEHESEE